MHGENIIAEITNPFLQCHCTVGTACAFDMDLTMQDIQMKYWVENFLYYSFIMQWSFLLCSWITNARCYS